MICRFVFSRLERCSYIRAWGVSVCAAQSGRIDDAFLKRAHKCGFSKELLTVIEVLRYDSGYLTCSKKLTGSQLSLPHGINKKIKMHN